MLSVLKLKILESLQPQKYLDAKFNEDYFRVKNIPRYNALSYPAKAMDPESPTKLISTSASSKWIKQIIIRVKRTQLFSALLHFFDIWNRYLFFSIKIIPQF